MQRTEIQEAFIRGLESRAGRLLPQDVLNAARNPESPIHECFEWNDCLAAESFRLDQARDLIRRVRIEVEHEAVSFKSVRYVRDVRRGAAESGYRNILKVHGRTAVETLQAEWSSVAALAERAANITRAKVCDWPDESRWVVAADEVLSALRAILKGE